MLSSIRFAVALVALATSLPAQLALTPKQVAAPAEEILAGHLRLPDPAASALRTRAAWIDVEFDGAGVFETSFPVEGDGRLQLAPLVGDPAAWRVFVAEPGGSLLEAREWTRAGEGLLSERDFGRAFGLSAARAQLWELRTVRSGDWRVRVESVSESAAPGVLVVSALGETRELVTQMAHWNLTTTGQPALLARIERSGAPGVALREVLASPPSLNVQLPSGARRTLLLHDDGLHQDGAAADGVWGVELPVDEVGELQLRVEARGTSAEGGFLRSVPHRVTLHGAEVELSGFVMARLSDPLHVEFGLAASVAEPGRKLQVSAEVWGTTPEGQSVPVAWLSRMTSLRGESAPHLPLSLDLRWLARAGAGLPLELREVRVQDPDSHVPLATAATLNVPALRLPAVARAEPGPITTEMLTGFSAALGGLQPPPLSAGPLGEQGTLKLPTPTPEPVRALLLSHGYCAGLAWPVNQFSGERLVLDDQDQNRSHDEFAQIMAATGAGVDSFGVVAHSQGGTAALHLLTYYMSGLDLAIDGRRIQSVGTPYQGTPLAGGLAIFGQIFGSGCGSNDDLSTDGAALWLAGIPSWARAEVHYYTTANSGSACNFISGLFLDNPEDGVVERDRAQLPGANNEGHKTGWCHTTGMSDPAQYNDGARNAEMDAAAAR